MGAAKYVLMLSPQHTLVNHLALSGSRLPERAPGVCLCILRRRPISTRAAYTAIGVYSDGARARGHSQNRCGRAVVVSANMRLCKQTDAAGRAQSLTVRPAPLCMLMARPGHCKTAQGVSKPADLVLSRLSLTPDAAHVWKTSTHTRKIRV